MRDYLYIWNSPKESFAVASGLEFRDFVPLLEARGGVLLLKHRATTARPFPESRFAYTVRQDVTRLASEDIYGWGDLAWVDFSGPLAPSCTKDEMAALRHFTRKGKPRGAMESLQSLGNRFLAYGHDDGWYLKLYYSDWRHVEALLAEAPIPAMRKLDIGELKRGERAFWLAGGAVTPEELTFDIDSLLNRRF